MTGQAEDFSSGAQHYRIFGLTVESRIPLPEATRLDSRLESAPVDVRIKLGQTPPALLADQFEGSWVKVRDTTCVLSFRGFGRFVVEDGQRILVERDPEATLDDLRPFLFGSAFAALLYQRGLVPLHVSAVATPSGVVAFTGESGAGKSTLAARLNQELNWPLICDDVAVIRRDSAGYHLISGVNTIKLWLDALQSLDQSTEGLRRDLSRYDKFHAIQEEKFFKGVMPFKHLVQLGWGTELKLTSINGRDAFQAALGAVYRPELALTPSNRSNVAKTALALATDIKLRLLVRPKDHSWGARIAALVKSEFADPK